MNAGRYVRADQFSPQNFRRLHGLLPRYQPLLVTSCETWRTAKCLRARRRNHRLASRTGGADHELLSGDPGPAEKPDAAAVHDAVRIRDRRSGVAGVGLARSLPADRIVFSRQRSLRDLAEYVASRSRNGDEAQGSVGHYRVDRRTRQPTHLVRSSRARQAANASTRPNIGRW